MTAKMSLETLYAPGSHMRWVGPCLIWSAYINIEYLLLLTKLLYHDSYFYFLDTEGRAGMAVIQADAKNVDLKKFHEAITERLPTYAVPIFIRFSSNIEVTGKYF